MTLPITRAWVEKSPAKWLFQMSVSACRLISSQIQCDAAQT